MARRKRDLAGVLQSVRAPARGAASRRPRAPAEPRPSSRSPPGGARFGKAACPAATVCRWRRAVTGAPAAGDGSGAVRARPHGRCRATAQAAQRAGLRGRGAAGGGLRPARLRSARRHGEDGFDDALRLIGVEQRRRDPRRVDRRNRSIRHGRAGGFATSGTGRQAAAMRSAPLQTSMTAMSRKSTRCWAAGKAKSGSKNGLASMARAASWRQACAMSPQRRACGISMAMRASGR